MYRIPFLMFLLVLGIHTMAQTREDLFARDHDALLSELRGMLELDQQYRESNRAVSAELAQKRDAIDDANARRMIAIINTYGFPSRQRFRIRKKDGLLPHIILVHAPMVYADTLKNLLEPEHIAGHMTEFEYAHLMWHLNGRKEPIATHGEKFRRAKGKKTVVITELKED